MKIPSKSRRRKRKTFSARDSETVRRSLDTKISPITEDIMALKWNTQGHDTKETKRTPMMRPKLGFALDQDMV
jgi:hypothetical protein